MSNIKEFYLGVDGEVSVEYSDNTTKNFNLTNTLTTDPLTGELDPDTATVIKEAVGVNQDGSISAVVQPRTGTFSELTSVTSSLVGELASSPSDRGIAIMSGSGVGSVVWSKRGGTQNYVVTGSGSVSVPASVIDTRYSRCILTKSDGVTVIGGILTGAAFTNGTVKGESFELQNETGLTLFGPVAGTGAAPYNYADLPTGYSLTFVWGGSSWIGKSAVRSSQVGTVYGMAKAISSQSALHVGLGGTSSNVVYPVVIGNGKVSADFGFSMPSGEIKPKATRGTALSASICRWPGSTTYSSNPMGAPNYEGANYVMEFHNNIVFTGYTSGAGTANLAFDGSSTLTDLNTIVASDFNGLLFLDLLVNCEDYTASPYKWARMERTLVLVSDGSVMSLAGGVRGIGTDIFEGAGYTPAVAITVVSNRLQITATGVSGADVEWVVTGSARAGVYK